MLDARAAGLDAPALRHWARHVAAASGAPYTTRSYRYPYALVAWHSRPVGVDIERVEPCDTPLADLICTPEERVGAAGATDPDGYVTSLWSAKEALAKALGDALAYEPSRLSSPAHWPGGRAGPWRAGQPAAPPGHVAWLCWRSVSSRQCQCRAERCRCGGPVRRCRCGRCRAPVPSDRSLWGWSDSFRGVPRAGA